MEEGNTLVNALIGGAITLFAGFIPLTPVFGGGVAGYLQGGTRRDGARVGAYSGLIAFVPTLLIAFVLGSLLSLGFGLGFVPFLGSVAVGIIGFLFVTFGLAYYVGGGAVGGWLGNYLKYDTDVEL